MDIQTFVFVDLECTHLPNHVPPFGPVRITEVSLLACRASQFKRPCRVTDCLSFCVRPQQNVAPETTQLTGKDNHLTPNPHPQSCPAPDFQQAILNERLKTSLGLDDFNLVNQRTFAEIAPSITSFLRTLDEPICLLAHNGDALDFPLLKAELDACGECWDGIDIRLCDTYPMFRRFGDDLDDICSVTEVVPDLINENIDLKNNSSELASDEYGMKTPPRDLQPPRPNNPPPAPSKKQRFASRLVESPVLKCNKKPRYTKGHFKLSEIYRRIVKREPVGAHCALTDCQMLFHCVLMKRRQFIHYLESTHRMMFSAVKPLWVDNRGSSAAMDCMVTRSGRVLATPRNAPCVVDTPADVEMRTRRANTPPRKHQAHVTHLDRTPKSKGRRLMPRRLIPDEDGGVAGGDSDGDFVPLQDSDDEAIIREVSEQPEVDQEALHNDRRNRVVCNLLQKF